MADHRGVFADSPPCTAYTLDHPPTDHRARWRREVDEWSRGRRLASLVLDHPAAVLYERHSLFGSVGAHVVPRWRSHGVDVCHVLEVNAPQSAERAQIGHLSLVRSARALERRRLRRADRVVVVSPWLAEWATERGVADHKIRVVPNGSPEFQASGGPELRKILGIDGPTVGFVGSMKRWHGNHRLPAILHHLPDTHALVVGVGPEQLPVHPRIHALGFLRGEQLNAAIHATDVGVAPYGTDAPRYFSPLKIAHWRAAGVPVVVPRHAGLSHLIGEGGLMVDDDRPQTWARQITRATGMRPPCQPRPWAAVMAEALAGRPLGRLGCGAEAPCT